MLTLHCNFYFGVSCHILFYLFILLNSWKVFGDVTSWYCFKILLSIIKELLFEIKTTKWPKSNIAKLPQMQTYVAWLIVH